MSTSRHQSNEKKPYNNKSNAIASTSNSNNSTSTSSSSTATTSKFRSTSSTKPQPSKGRVKANDSLDLSKEILTITPSLISYTNLHKLNLTECGLKEIGFVKEAKLTLTWLNVSGNDLSGKTAWDGVEELGRLFVLNASNCTLKEVPSIVESLHSLKALVISHNSLTALDHIKSLANLNTLVVSNNSLTYLPDSLTTLASLKKISAAHNLLTPVTLPDLSVNSQLKEIKFNDNPHLNSLPPHFSNWGKGSLGNIEFKGKRKSGLEIVDLGSCGFKDWSGLKELAGQDMIVNLGLKGNLVAEEAKAEGFEEFRNKITILLPALRILDGQRFDPKFFDLKAKRALRPAEQRIVDSGPMGLAINAAASAPIEVAKEVERRRKRKLDLVGLDDAAEKELEEVKRKKLEEKEIRRKAYEEKTKKKTIVKNVVTELKKKKGNNKRKAEEVVDEEAVEESVPVKEKHKKKSKLTVEDSTTAPAITAEESTPSKPTPTEPEAPLVRKRGRKSAHISALTIPLIIPPRSTSTASTSILNPLIRKKKLPGGVLSALKGSEEEQAQEKLNQYIPTGANAILEKPSQEVVQKEKTSVLKVVEVQRKKESKKVDVSTLLMGKKTEEVGLGGWN